LLQRAIGAEGDDGSILLGLRELRLRLFDPPCKGEEAVNRAEEVSELVRF
jgi:hypothetical protein